MQNVLDIKERLETQAKTEYAEMNNRLFIEEETMKRLGKGLIHMKSCEKLCIRKT